MDYHYDTEDNLTFEQASKFMTLVREGVGTASELSHSSSGEPNEYYVTVFDIEEMDEVKFCRKAEAECLKTIH